MTPGDSVRVHAEERLYSGPIFDLRRSRLTLPSGREQDLVVVEHPGAVCIAPVDAQGRLLVVRQYRHAVRDWTLELPAGRLEEGETPLAAARRELEEETGHRAGEWTSLGALLAAPGFCSERLHLFLARDLQAVGEGALAPDPDEEIECLWRWPAELVNETDDAKTLVAAYRLLAERAP